MKLEFRSRRLRTIVLLALASFGALAAPSAQSAQPPGPTTVVGRSVVLGGEQVHTVVAAEEWHGSGEWVPGPGKVTVTVLVRIKALKTTSYNPLFYGLRDASGTVRQVVFSVNERAPALRSSNRLRRGKTVKGWLTFSVPKARARSLALVYRMSAGYGPRLVVKIGRAAVRQARVGAAYAVGDEHQLVVAGAERWADTGAQAKAGRELVSVQLRITARASTAPGAFSLLDGNGNHYHATSLREPGLSWKAPLAAGQTLEGWVTFAVPAAQVGSLRLCYHVHVGGPSVIVPLGAVPVRPQPPFADARLQGDFDVVQTYTAVNGFTSLKVGDTDDVTFTLTPQCGAGPCDAQLTFPAETSIGIGSKTVTVPLTRSGADYTGTAPAALSSCSFSPVTGTLEMQLQISGAAWIDGSWRAATITGRERYSTPRFSTGIWVCPPASWEASLTGSPAG